MSGDKKISPHITCLLSCEQPLSSKDIAEYIGVHYATVSRAIKKIEREDEK